MTPLFKDADAHEVRSINTAGGRHLLTADNAARVVFNRSDLVEVYGGFALVDLPAGPNVVELLPVAGERVSVSLSKLHPVEEVR